MRFRFDPLLRIALMPNRFERYELSLIASRRLVRSGKGLLNGRILSQAGYFHQRLSDDLF